MCVCVCRNGKYFKVEVVNRKGRLISARQLKEKLQYVVNLAGDDVDERFIAALTAQDRPTWAKVRGRGTVRFPSPVCSVRMNVCHFDFGSAACYCRVGLHYSDWTDCQCAHVCTLSPTCLIVAKEDPRSRPSQQTGPASH